MVRRFGLLILALGLAIPVTAAEKPAAISGYVRSAEGAPQMGAMVEVLGSAVHTLKVFTDANGFYSASGLIPGVYNVRVSALSFLPALREGVGLRAGCPAFPRQAVASGRSTAERLLEKVRRIEITC